MVKFHLIIWLVAVTITACNRSETRFWTGEIHHLPDEITFREVSLEPIRLDSINCSYNGFSGILSNRAIYYLDKHFGYLYEFNADGRLMKRSLGMGRGPNETIIGRLAGHAVTKNGEFVLFGSNVDFEVFDSSLNVKKRFVIPFQPNRSESDAFDTYSYVWDNMVCRAYGNVLYIGMQSQNPKFNYLDQTATFLRTGHHIGRIDLAQKKSLPMILKGFPRLYHDAPEKYMAASYVHFDIAEEGTFFVQFEADSLVYVFDKRLEPLFAFGRSGRDMDWDYQPVHSWNDADRFRANRKSKGRYARIEYVDRTGYLFRSYRKGNAPTDGLQIYKDETLVGDVDVPKGFYVTGYIPPYYYSQVYEDDLSEEMIIYRFQL